MKGKVTLIVVLFLILFLIPFFAMETKAPEKAAASSGSSPTGSTVPTKSSTPVVSSPPQTKTGFKILDSSSGNILSVDDRSFLYGAIAVEMSPANPVEALKAQGVAAYTYYSHLREQQRQNPTSSLNGADFSADTKNWQIYVTKEQMQTRWGSNFSDYYNSLTKAVDAINGMVLKYNGQLIDATYFAISSGKTETSEDIWGGKRSYLVSVASPGDAFAGGYQTTVTMTADQFKAAALKAAPKANLGGDAAAWIGSAKRTSAGSVESMVIGGATITGSAARSAFGLRSANFTVSYANSKFTFLVKGYGHGVGMSQVGAQYMAKQGSTYKQILAWYYPTATLTPLNA